MSQQDNRHPSGHETRDEDWPERTSLAGVRIAHAYEDGVMVMGIAAETLPTALRRRCVAAARYRAATGHEPAWLVIDSTEERIVAR